jgi:hypothetical protein
MNILEKNKSHKQMKSRKETLQKQQNGSNYYITFNINTVNCLNSPIKRHRMTHWMRKQETFVAYMNCITHTHTHTHTHQKKKEKLE